MRNFRAHTRAPGWGSSRRESSRARAARRWNLAPTAEAAGAVTLVGSEAGNLLVGGAPRRRITDGAIFAIAAAALAATLIWNLGAERRAIRNMPPAERQHAYARSLESFRSLCTTDRAESLRSHCRQQAQMLLSFPECDGYCESLVSQELRARR